MHKLFISLGLTLTLLVGVGLYFIQGNSHGFNASLSNPQLRAEWEHMITQDPATGLVDVSRKEELTFASNLPSMRLGNGRGNDYEWEARGPFNFGGRTRGAAFDVRNEDIMIAGSVSGGIYKSIDGGQSWSRKSDSTQQWGITCLVQDKKAGNEDIWYAGSGEDYNSASNAGGRYVGNGILKSTDNGETWFALENTQTGSPEALDYWDKIWRVVTDPVQSGEVVLAAITGRIMRSDDGGDTWTAVLGGSGASATYTDIAVSSTGVYYATLSSDGATKGIYRSVDGINWVDIRPSNWPSAYNRMVIGITPSNEKEVYFLAATPGAGKKTYDFRHTQERVSLWKYSFINGDGTGAGGFWTNLNANVPAGPYRFDDLNLQGGYNMLVSVSPTDPDLVILGGTNLFRSTTGFADSTHTTFVGGYGETTDLPDFQVYQNHHPDQHLVFFSELDSKVIISCNDGGIMRTDDITATPVVWKSLNNSYNTTQFYSLAIDHGTENSFEMMGGLQDNGTFHNLTSDPAAWKLPWSYDGAYTAIADGGSMHLTSIQLGRMFKVKLDANGNRTAWKRFDPIGASSYYFIHPWSMDPNDNGIVYLPVGTKLWRNDMVDELPFDNGTDSISTGWTQLPFNLNGNGSCAGISTKNPANRVYVGTSTGNLYRLDEAQGTSATFTDLSNNISGSGYLNCVAVDPENADHAMAIYSSYKVHSIHYTEDGGATWFRAGGNLEAATGPEGAPEDLYSISSAPSIRWARIVNTEGGKVYLVGTSVGLFATNKLEPGVDRTTDATVWYQVAKSEIGNTLVTMIDHRESDRFVAVATHGAGIFSATIPNNWLITDLAEIDRSSDLSVYPNPAINQFVVLSSAEINRIEIFDQQGKKCKELAGNGKQIQINRGTLRAGIYFVKVHSSHSTQIKKMILL
jgi:photosystem II stability/assembly factor-like uncharacterized protein